VSGDNMEIMLVFIARAKTERRVLVDMTAETLRP
jgi:hypothetical protein